MTEDEFVTMATYRMEYTCVIFKYWSYNFLIYWLPVPVYFTWYLYLSYFILFNIFFHILFLFVICLCVFFWHVLYLYHIQNEWTEKQRKQIKSNIKTVNETLKANMAWQHFPEVILDINI